MAELILFYIFVEQECIKMYRDLFEANYHYLAKE